MTHLISNLSSINEQPHPSSITLELTDKILDTILQAQKTVIENKKNNMPVSSIKLNIDLFPNPLLLSIDPRTNQISDDEDKSTLILQSIQENNSINANNALCNEDPVPPQDSDFWYDTDNEIDNAFAEISEDTIYFLVYTKNNVRCTSDSIRISDLFKALGKKAEISSNQPTYILNFNSHNQPCLPIHIHVKNSNNQLSLDIEQGEWKSNITIEADATEEDAAVINILGDDEDPLLGRFSA